MYATFTRPTGPVQHYRQRSVNPEIAVFLGIGSIPAGLLGVAPLEVMQGVPDEEMLKAVMITIIAITLVLVGGSLSGRWADISSGLPR